MPEAFERAVTLLRERGGYDWLLSGPEAFFADDVAEQLTASGVRVTRDTVARWFKDLPHTQNFGKLGLSATRRDLIEFFASKFIHGSEAIND
jgi:hypothetical protein